MRKHCLGNSCTPTCSSCCVRCSECLLLAINSSTGCAKPWVISWNCTLTNGIWKKKANTTQRLFISRTGWKVLNLIPTWFVPQWVPHFYTSAPEFTVWHPYAVRKQRFTSLCRWKEAGMHLGRQRKPCNFSSWHPGFLTAFGRRHSCASDTALEKLAPFALCSHDPWIVWEFSLQSYVVCLQETQYHLKKCGLFIFCIYLFSLTDVIAL